MGYRRWSSSTTRMVTLAVISNDHLHTASRNLGGFAAQPSCGPRLTLSLLSQPNNSKAQAAAGVLFYADPTRLIKMGAAAIHIMRFVMHRGWLKPCWT